MVSNDPVKQTPREANDFQRGSDSADPHIKNIDIATELIIQMIQIMKQKTVIERMRILLFFCAANI